MGRQGEASASRGGELSGSHQCWGRSAAVWSLLFAAVHVFWALGGQAGLASSAGETLAAVRPTWFVVAGLWGSALLLMGAGGIGTVVAGIGVGARQWVRVVAGLIAGVLLLRAIGVEVLLLSGAGGVDEAVGRGERAASLWVWNPWFLLGGILFALATLAARSRR